MQQPARATSAETAFLGTIVLMGSNSQRFNVTPEMFFDIGNRTICESVNEMMLKGVPVDPVTLGECLAQNGQLEYCGGINRLLEVLDGTPGTHNVEHYAEAIRAAYAKRELQYTIRQLEASISNGEFDYDEAVERIRKAGQQRPARGRSALPVGDLIEQFPEMRPILIDGLLRKGETMNLVSGTKVGKSWLAIGLAISLATGRKWMEKFETTKGKILHIDTELHPETLSNRIKSVAESMGVDLSELGDYLAIPVRGQGWSVNNLSEEIAEHKPDIVLLDALYRAVPKNQDENSNREMAAIYNAIDEAADEYQAGIILVHHSSKGSQAGKANTDIGSGAGAMSRAVDTHATLVAAEDAPEGVMAFNASLRSFAQMEPILMERNHPLWAPVGSIPTQSHGQAAARRLLGEEPKKTDATTDEMIRVIRKILRIHKKLTKKEIMGHWLEQSGGLPLPTGGSMGRLLKRAVEAGDIEQKGRAPKSWYEMPGDVIEL